MTTDAAGRSGGGVRGGSTVSSVGCPSVCYFYLSNLLLPLCFSKHIITSLQRILPHFYLKSQVELKVYPPWNNTLPHFPLVLDRGVPVEPVYCAAQLPGKGAP